jgi:hypothetical protein
MQQQTEKPTEPVVVVSDVSNIPPLGKPLFDRIDFDLPRQKIEYIRSRGYVVRDPQTNEILKDERTKEHLRTRGHVRGIFLAYLDDEGKEVKIGYSLCNKRDCFDHRKGIRIDGLGVLYALHKAEKHKDSRQFIISTRPEDRQLPKEIVKIPQSIADDLQHFVYRCSRFYKGKTLPKWAADFALDGHQPLDEKAI